MTADGHISRRSSVAVQISTFLFISLVMTSLCESAIFTDVHWSTAIKLSHYEGYKSVSILTYKVPENSLHTEFTFQAKTSGKGCNFRTVHLYFQHGSYPLVNLYNETYPEHFFLNRTDSFHAVIHESADATTYAVARPRPGVWYFAAFLPKEDDKTERIQQKGLDSSCLYGMFVMVTSRGVDNIPDILTDKPISLHLKKDEFHDQMIFRYMLPRETVAYTVKVGNCMVKAYSPPKQLGDEKLSTNNITKDNLTDGTDTSTLLSNSSLSPTEELSTPQSTTSSTEHVFSTNITETNGSSSVGNYTSDTNSTNITETTSSPQPTPTQTVNPTIQPGDTRCPVVMMIQQDRLPSVERTEKIVCENETVCQKSYLSPLVDRWTYIDIAIHAGSNVSELTMDLSFELESCESLKLLSPDIINNVTVGMNVTKYDARSLPQTTCIIMDPLGRFMMSERAFNVTYLLASNNPMPVPLPLYDIRIPDYHVLVTAVQVREPADIGGTLRLNLQTTKHSLPELHPQYAMVYLCLMKNAVPGGSNTKSCEAGILLSANTSDPNSSTVYVPYPEPASYFLGFLGQCYLKDGNVPVVCSIQPKVNVEVGISGCVQNQCGEYGACRNYISGVYVFSSCVCFAGWRGYGCTDGTEARSRLAELTAVLLLTLTNLCFLPAVIVAVLRKHFIEAWVYLFTMFFSGFYHACDASDLVYYCLVDYDVLSFADFVGSIASFWVTLLALSRIPEKLRWFGHMFGVMGVAVGTEYDRHGIWTFAIPAVLGVIIMIASWVYQCKTRKGIYPSKRYYLLQLLPGILLAATGLVLFAFFETEQNYKYTHSAWHVCMSTCVVFLLPRPEKKGMDIVQDTSMANSDVTTSAGLVLNSYTTNSMPNGVTPISTLSANADYDNICIETGDNPAYSAPD